MNPFKCNCNGARIKGWTPPEDYCDEGKGWSEDDWACTVNLEDVEEESEVELPDEAVEVKVYEQEEVKVDDELEIDGKEDDDEIGDFGNLDDKTDENDEFISDGDDYDT